MTLFTKMTHISDQMKDSKLKLPKLDIGEILENEEVVKVTIEKS